MIAHQTYTQNDIITIYMAYVLEHHQQPKSVYAFAKANHFEESLFYSFFGDFEAVEKASFKAFYDATITALHTSEDYPSFDARHKLLSFHYTFFENLSANRSYVIYLLRNHKNNIQRLQVLSTLKKSFLNYIDDLNIDTLNIQQQQLASLQQKGIKASFWAQLIMTMKFWLDDTSVSFEKTDIFIEKSIHTGFDLLAVKPLNSVIDLSKFLLKEKINITF